MATRTIPLTEPIDLAGTLFPLVRGLGDPTMRVRGDEAIRALRTADGPATVRAHAFADRVDCEAWGPGAALALEDAPAFVGAIDDWSSFRPHDDVVARLRREHPGLRLAASRAVSATLIAAICEQKVTGQEARRAFRVLTRAASDPAPGPGALLLPPDPARVAALPSAVFHRAGLDGPRGHTLRAVCRRADTLDRLVSAGVDRAKAALSSLRGVGAWTTAEVARLALGDPDAVSVGDFHLPNLVAWLLAGEPRGTDERMLELLAPYEGHRGRVQRLLEASGAHAPRFGPRMETRQILDA
jgi:3-methyladenine DNA glycosylase/8-oxoguanine DNA glycosylase